MVSDDFPPAAVTFADKSQGGAFQSYSGAFGASAGADNSVFLAGAVYGLDGWDGHLPSGGYDFAVVKLDEDGDFLWAWLVSTIILYHSY